MTAEIAALIPQVPAIPGSPERLEALLFLTFILHTLMMNIVVGGVLITLFNQLRKPDKAEGHREFAALLPKGMALVVNLGVPPLLFVQALLGAYFYSAAGLTALYWLAVPFVVMFAYYGLYIYTAPGRLHTKLRTFVLALTALLLLGNSFLFVNNATLIQDPETWSAYALKAGGIVLNLGDPQLWPRWLHVVFSCLAVGGLSFALPAWLKLRNLARADAPLPRQQVWFDRMQSGYRWFIWASVIQIPIGVWFLFSLPEAQQNLFLGGRLTGLFVSSIIFAGSSMVTAVRRMIGFTVSLTVCSLICMTGMRSMMRVSMLEPYGAGGMFGDVGGPIWLFLGSALVSGVVVYRLFHIYRKARVKEAV